MDDIGNGLDNGAIFSILRIAEVDMNLEVPEFSLVVFLFCGDCLLGSFELDQRPRSQRCIKRQGLKQLGDLGCKTSRQCYSNSCVGSKSDSDYSPTMQDLEPYPSKTLAKSACVILGSRLLMYSELVGSDARPWW